MQRLASAALIAATSSAFLFWFDVSPHGEELCNSNAQFQTVAGEPSEVAAAANAKSLFCRTVASLAI